MTISPKNAHRHVWLMAGPVMLSNMLVPLVGVVDTAVVGHLSTPHSLSAISISSAIFSYLFWSFGFLQMSTTGLTAQAFGCQDKATVQAILLRASILAVGLGILLVLLQMPIGLLVFSFFSTNTQVETEAFIYFSIRVWGAPITLANYVLLGWFFGVQKAGSALLFQVVINGVNAILSLLFVISFGWGVAGVALASVIGEIVGLITALLLVRIALRQLGGDSTEYRLFDSNQFRRLFTLNKHLFVRTIALLSVTAYFIQQSAAMGETILAANAILLNFLSFMSYGLDGFSHAAEALAGSAFGARDRNTFRLIVKSSTFWAAVVSVLYVIVYGIAGHWLITVMTSLPEIQAVATIYLPWLVISPLLSVWCFQLDGIFLSATRTREMRDSVLIAFVLFVIAVNLGKSFWGNHALWASFMLFMVLRTLVLGMFYPRIERDLE
jgi:MATE family multidrug resistance protein